MNLTSILLEVGIYGVAWTFISFGLTLLLAAAFFGIREEKNLEKNQDVL
tara:strand:+ start:733 stop:879 length:147 start_codon:yes stop_codon:yes gene_type:complete